VLVSLSFDEHMAFVEAEHLDGFSGETWYTGQIHITSGRHGM